MGKHFFWLHCSNFIVRLLAVILLFLYVTTSNIVSLVPAFLICAGLLSVSYAIWRGYIHMDRTLDISLQQIIATMPLFDLVEMLNYRDDIKRLVINELEETET